MQTLNNLKLSSKMHLLIIISSIIIALGLAVGTVCHFVANGFFNYSDDFASYKSVTVSYEDIDFSGSGKDPLEPIAEICEKAFKDAGVASYITENGDTTTGGRIEYRFTTVASDEKLAAAVEAINAEIKKEVLSEGGIQFSYASLHTAETLLGGGKAISMAAITIACAVALHFVYFIIRFRLTMALGALLADIHNFALFIALLALCRVPLGSTIATFAVLTVLITIIGTCFLFDRVRKNCKDDNLKKLSVFELTDKSANESLLINTVMPACLAALSVVLFVLLSISSLSPLAILAPVLCSLVAFVTCAYGTAIFTPAVYSHIKLVGDAMHKKSVDKAKILSK